MNERTTTTDARADGILTPEELSPDEDHVTDLGEGRFVVSAGEGPSAGTHDGGARLSSADAALAAPPDDGSRAASPAPADVLANANERYGVDVTIKTDDGIARETTTSNDIREVFSTMVTWYANQLDDDLDAAETLRILLDASEIEV